MVSKNLLRRLFTRPFRSRRPATVRKQPRPLGRVIVQLEDRITPATGKVAILGAPGNAAWNTDVQTQIAATGLYTAAQIDIINTTSSTPSLATLDNYDSVITFSDTGYQDGNTLGTNLASYVNQGHGVVVATFAFNGGQSLGGTWASGSYSPYTINGFITGHQTLGAVNQPGHPVMAGVSTFDGGSSSYRDTITLTGGSSLIASWSDGLPLAAEKPGFAGKIIGLNFYPPSNAARSDFWLTSTNGGRLLANALRYTGGGASLIYRTSANFGTSLGDDGFEVYNTLTNTWTPLNPYPTNAQMTVSTSGNLYARNELTGNIQVYNSGSDTWSNVMAGPAAGSNMGDLEVTTSGQFYYYEATNNQLFYNTGPGTWNSISMPASLSMSGDYDPATNALYISQFNSTAMFKVDATTHAVTPFNIGSTGDGEFRRFGEVLGNRFYAMGGNQANVAYSFDVTNPAAAQQFTTISGNPSITSFYPSGAADPGAGAIFINALSGTGAFGKWNPTTNTLTTLAAPTISLNNHSTLALVSGAVVANQPPTVAANNASVTVNEGQTAANTGTYSDPDAGDNVTITASVGTVTKTGTNSGTWSWSFNTVDGPAQSQTVTITANDGNGHVVPTTFGLTVNNVAPSATGGLAGSYSPAISFTSHDGGDLAGMAFDGTHYWSVSGGFPTADAEYTAAGGFIGTFGPGLDFRSDFTDAGGNVYARAFNNPTIYKQTSPGTFTPFVTLSGGSLDAQSSVVLNGAGTEYDAMSGGTVSRWNLAGTFLGTVSLSGFGSLDANENVYPANRGLAAVGNFWLTYDNGKLSYWNFSGNRVGTTTLTGAGSSFDSNFSISYANGMVFIGDFGGGTWRGYAVSNNPIGGLTGPTSLAFGGTFSGNFSFTDPGVLDATWVVNVSIDDKPVATQLVYNNNGPVPANQPINYTFYHSGKHTISVTVTDKDGGTSAVSTLVVNVAQPNVVYVDAGWAGTLIGNPVGPGHYFGLFDNGEGSGPQGGDAFSSINQAVTAVAPGGLILVDAGTYPEAVNLSKSLTMQLQGGVTVNSLAGVAAATVNTNGQVLTIADGGGATFSGPITGSGGLVKNGPGTQTLAGGNTWAGTTTINGGTLTLTGSLTGAAAPVTINGNNVTLNGNGVINGRGVVVAGGITNALISGLGGITNNPTGVGITVSPGASARILNDMVTGNNIGVLVDGGTALLQGDNLSNDTGGSGSTAAGLVAQNGAVVDAGQLPSSAPYYGNITGFGTSTGGNTFLGYTAAIGNTNPAVPQAIRDLNTGGVYGGVGPQLGAADLPAQADNFGVPASSLNEIEKLIFHDLDNSAYGFVSYGTATGNSSLVQEGGAAIRYYVTNPGALSAGTGFSTDTLGQKSLNRYVQMTFDSFVYIPAGSITLQKVSGPGGPGAVTVTALSAYYDVAASKYRVVFGYSGSSAVIDPGSAGSLADGNYTLTVTNGVQSGGPGGNPVTGAPVTSMFWRHFGDIVTGTTTPTAPNGDRWVNDADLSGMRSALRSRVGMANYRADLDFNNDGIIDSTDYNQFLVRYHHRLNEDGSITTS
jgi:autotransporter-associated beta strand protein